VAGHRRWQARISAVRRGCGIEFNEIGDGTDRAFCQACRKRDQPAAGIAGRVPVAGVRAGGGIAGPPLPVQSIKQPQLDVHPRLHNQGSYRMKDTTDALGLAGGGLVIIRFDHRGWTAC
jgi:hypothetical protein